MKRLYKFFSVFSVFSVFSISVAIAQDTTMTKEDSVAYIFGTMQTNGLKNYLVQQLNVDTAYMEAFYKGLNERVCVSDSDKVKQAELAGYEIGGQFLNFIKQVSKQYYPGTENKQLNKDVVIKAVIASLKGENSLSAEDAKTQFDAIMQKKQTENLELTYGANRVAGEQWLSENKKKPGVITLPSGLQYKVLTKGTGAVPTATDKVSVNYEGHLIDGTEFDSSYKRGKASEFRCNQVIKGWTEALTHMPVGSKWEVYIPQELAYGERDSGKIKPYSALIFTVELLGIVK